MVRFVRDEDDTLLGEVIISGAALACGVQVGVQFLDGGQAQVDAVGLRFAEVVYRTHLHALPAQLYHRCKEVLARGRIQKILTRFFDDVGRVDKEQEIAVPLRVEVQHEPRHDECLAAARCHVKEQVVQGGGVLPVALPIA